MNYQQYKQYKQVAFSQNPELRKEYEALAPQYQIINDVIAARIQMNMTQAELAVRGCFKSRSHT